MYTRRDASQFDGHPIASNGLIVSHNNGILCISNSSQFDVEMITEPATEYQVPIQSSLHPSSEATTTPITAADQGIE